MANKVKADQAGAQDRGQVAQGNNNVQLRDSASQNSVTGAGGNVSISNGVSGDQLTTILGTITKPSSSAVSAATPPALTPPATTADSKVAGFDKKKLLVYGLAGVSVFFLVLLIRKIFKP